MGGTGKAPKYQKVFDALQREIQSGRVKAGDRLPSEAELERKFGASRITVGRAVRDLQLAGLVERRAGSGSYVKARNVSEALSFGLNTRRRGPEPALTVTKGGVEGVSAGFVGSTR